MCSEARGLNIVVCVARVLDTSEPLPVTRGEAALDETGMIRVLNPVDEYALEEGLRLKDLFPGSWVTAISIGPSEDEAALRRRLPPGAQAALRRCLAMGCDGAVLLWDESFPGSDTLATARILAAAIGQMDADLVLCGKRASDGDTGQVGPQLAELLGLPAVCGVIQIEVRDGAALVHRRLERGRRAVIRCPLPALFAVEEGINLPRYPRLLVRLRSEKAEVPRRGREELGLRPEEVGELGSCVHVVSLSPPKPITKGLVIPDSSLSAEERWQQVIAGGMEERQGDLIQGEPDSVAERLLQFLTQNEFV